MVWGWQQGIGFDVSAETRHASGTCSTFTSTSFCRAESDQVGMGLATERSFLLLSARTRQASGTCSTFTSASSCKADSNQVGNRGLVCSVIPKL